MTARLKRPETLLLIAGLAVHAGAVGYTKSQTGSIDGFALRSLDAGEYLQLGRNLASHGAFSTDDEPPWTPHTWRTPGYPLFLAACVAVFGDAMAPPLLVQQALSILNVLILYWIARSWMSRRRATAAALLFLIEPYHVYYSLWLMSTTLFTTLILTSWLLWRHVLRTRGRRWGCVLGVLIGYAVLVRPAGILIPFVLLLGLILAIVRNRAVAAPSTIHRRAWLAVAVVAVSMAAPPVGWMLRNKQVAGHFALSDQAGIVLAYFKATEVELWKTDRAALRYVETSLNPADAAKPHDVWDSIDRRLQEAFPSLTAAQRAALTWRNLAQGNKAPVDSFAVSKGLTRIGWSMLAESPANTTACYLARTVSLLTFPLNLAVKPPATTKRNRFGDAAVGALYLLLCGAIFVRLVRRRLSFDRVYYPLAVTIALVVSAVPQLDPRFRVPMIPLLLIVASFPVTRSTQNVTEAA